MEIDVERLKTAGLLPGLLQIGERFAGRLGAAAGRLGRYATTAPVKPPDAHLPLSQRSTAEFLPLGRQTPGSLGQTMNFTPPPGREMSVPRILGTLGLGAGAGVGLGAGAAQLVKR